MPGLAVNRGFAERRGLCGGVPFVDSRVGRYRSAQVHRCCGSARDRIGGRRGWCSLSTVPQDSAVVPVSPRVRGTLTRGACPKASFQPLAAARTPLAPSEPYAAKVGCLSDGPAPRGGVPVRGIPGPVPANKAAVDGSWYRRCSLVAGRDDPSPRRTTAHGSNEARPLRARVCRANALWLRPLFHRRQQQRRPPDLCGVSA